MRCIFCLKEREPSCEHVLPEAIGGTLTIDRVCKPCNERLGGKVDCKLSDHLACVAMREELGMTDGEGRPVRFWAKFMRDGKLAADPTRTIEVRQDRETGNFTTKLRYHRQVQEGDDGAESVQISVDLSDIDRLPTIVQRERGRMGLPPLSGQEIEALKEEARKNVRTIEQPEVLHSVRADTELYKPAVAKIAYEIAWYWLGDAYLDDPRAAELRGYILGERDELSNARIAFNESYGGFAPWASEPNAHIALGASQGRSHAIALRIFNVFVGVLEVTVENERYAGKDWNQFLLVDPVTGARRESSLREELAGLGDRSYARRQS